MFVSTKELPTVLQQALKNKGYHKKDVDVKAANSVSIQCGGFKGSQGYAVAVNLGTGVAVKSLVGSWGGANAFENNQVDRDNQEHQIPYNGAVIKGYSGNFNNATIYVHPDNVAKFLPNVEDVTAEEKAVLRVWMRYKASYRRNELERDGFMGDIDVTIDGLVAKGMLKRNKAGAVSLTTKGKNAA